MNSLLKLTYIIIYILFLLAVIILFASINKNITSLFYIFIFVILLLGTGLFGLAMMNFKIKTNERKLTNTVDTESTQTTITNDATVEKIQEPEIEIDIQKILPLRPTEIDRYTEEVLQNMANDFHFVQALFYVKKTSKDSFQYSAQYAYFSETKPANFKTGETLPGQAVKNKAIVVYP